MGAKIALAALLTGCYGGFAVGPDRGSPYGGEDESGTGVQAFAGGEIELPKGGRLGFGVALGQSSIGEDPEGHTPKTTWAVLEVRYTHRILPDIPCGPVLGIGPMFGDSSDGSVRGGRALVGCETRTAPVIVGAGLAPQILWFDPDGNDAEDMTSAIRSLHLAAWIARAPRSARSPRGSDTRSNRMTPWAPRALRQRPPGPVDRSVR